MKDKLDNMTKDTQCKIDMKYKGILLSTIILKIKNVHVVEYLPTAHLSF